MDHWTTEHQETDIGIATATFVFTAPLLQGEPRVTYTSGTFTGYPKIVPLHKNVEVVLVIKYAPGVVEKNWKKKQLSRIPGQYNTHNIQRPAILATSYILNKILSIKPDNMVQASQSSEGLGLGYTADEVDKNKILIALRQYLQ